MLNLLKRRESSLLAIIIVVILAVTLRTPRFLTLSNFNDILKESSILVIISIAQFMVILTGGIDLSVASTMAFTGMSVALLNKTHPEISVAVIILISLAIGFGLGSFNGLLVSVFRIPPIITTLGTLNIYRGFVIVLSGGAWVSADQMTSAFRGFPQWRAIGISNLITVMILVALIVAFFLHMTAGGREVYGVGGNRLAARYVGVNTRRIDFTVFAVSGVLSGLAGYLLVAFYASAANDSAFGLELETVAACAIGGVSIMGGSGTLVGVLLGSLFLGIVKNALALVRISSFWIQAIQGFVILLAIVVNTVIERRNQRSSVKERVV